MALICRNLLKQCFNKQIQAYSTLSERSKAHLKYCLLPDKSFLQIRGPDTVKFLNGLVMAKLLPTYVQKNLTTIVPDESRTNNISVENFDMSHGNWGLYNEHGEGGGPYISRFGTYTGFLNSKGKLITDTIIYPTPTWLDSVYDKKFPEYLLELDSKIVKHMYDIFETHKLISKVKFKEVGGEKLKSWHISIQFPSLPEGIQNPWIDNLILPSESSKEPNTSLEFSKHILSLLFSGNEHKILGIYLDRRITEAIFRNNEEPEVFRIITTSEVSDISDLFNPQGFPFEFVHEQIDFQEVRNERFRFGIVDSLSDFKQEAMLPLEINFDYIPGAVSFDKGCYVGQELTARTYSTGVLRKRAIPVKIGNPDLLKSLHADKYPKILSSIALDTDSSDRPAFSPFGTATKTIKNKRQRPAGTLICFEADYGVALFRTDYLKEAFKKNTKGMFYVSIPDSEQKIIIEPQEPLWFNEWQEDQDK